MAVAGAGCHAGPSTGPGLAGLLEAKPLLAR